MFPDLLRLDYISLRINGLFFPKKNSYPENFINDLKCSSITQSVKEKIVPRKSLFLLLSYLGPLSLQGRT